MKRIVALAFMGATVASFAAETPEDFAYAMPIAAEPGEALYQVELPAALYRGVARADLGDLRVFNAKGEVVPHAIRQRARREAAPAGVVDLPLFPLRADRTGQLEDLQVRVRTRADGTVVDIRSGQKKTESGSATLGYLLDASQSSQPVQALLLEWKVPREGFVGKIHVEGSDDLARWNSITREASVLELEFGGHRLERKRVELRGQKYKYLRVSWPPNQKAVPLTAVRGETLADAREPQRAWVTLPQAGAGKNPGEYEYDVGGPVPFDRLRIELPQTNTLAQIAILTRDKAAEEWRMLGERLVYRLQREGNEVTSPEIDIAGRGRMLMLRVDQKGGGIGLGQPVVHLGYRPQQLVFAARGEGPFQLAYGSHAARAASFPIASLIPGHGTQREFPVKTATLGEPRKLAGEKQLRAPPDYKKWALWASLVLGVAGLGYMAYRLLRQMAPGTATPPRDADR